MDKTKLLKLLHLSESTNDGEALSSIRKANDLIKEDNSSWEDIVNISDALEEVIKRDRKNYRELEFIFKKERANSRDLEEKLVFATSIVKYLLSAIIILLATIILFVFK